MNLNSLLIIIIGILLKIIDDHYDMKLFSESVVNISQISIVILSIYLFTQDQTFTLMATLTCLYVLFAEGQMEDSDGDTVKFYYLFNAITYAFFIYYLVNGGYGKIISSITPMEIVRIMLFGLFIIYENKLVPEDISDRKILVRIIIVLIALGYSYYEAMSEEKTFIIRNIYLLAIGYMGMSVIDMLSIYDHQNHPELLGWGKTFSGVFSTLTSSKE